LQKHGQDKDAEGMMSREEEKYEASGKPWFVESDHEER
jgi:hypothetical protein